MGLGVEVAGVEAAGVEAAAVEVTNGLISSENDSNVLSADVRPRLPSIVSFNDGRLDRGEAGAVRFFPFLIASIIFWLFTTPLAMISWTIVLAGSRSASPSMAM